MRSVSIANRVPVRWQYDWRHEPVSASRKRLDKNRIVRRIPERVPQSLDRRIQAMVKVHKRIRGPKAASQLFPRHQIPRRFQQGRQYLSRLLLQLYARAIPPQLSRLPVELKLPKPDASIGLLLYRHGSPSSLNTKHVV